MKTIFFSMMFMLLFVFTVNSQTLKHSSIKRHGLFLELLLPINMGDDLGFGALNYEFRVGKLRKSSVRAGIYPNFNDFLTFPITYSRITSPLNKHHFEYGAGIALTITKFNNKWWSESPYFMFPLMYRYQSDNKIYFRGGINVILGISGLLPQPSFSIGVNL